jgi:histidinol-phosphate aminotransferase
LEALSPYKPPRAAEEARAEREAEQGAQRNGQGTEAFVKLTMNEVSFGPLPEAEAALAEALPRANRYPDRYAGALREAIAAANPGATPANVIVGNGLSEVLLNLLQLVERPGEVVFPWPSFGLFASICTVLGLTPRKVPLRDDHGIDEEALLGSVTDETRAVILCNPNNPTGTYLDLQDVTRIAERLPDRVLLILDEAYQEFVSDPAYHGSHALALGSPNVISARTFSKAHGLAGFRVGYAIASENVADYAERVRFPFSVNLAAQVAATASMQARDKVQGRADFVVRERERLQGAFGDTGLEYIPSQANFVLVRIAADVFERVGVLVREGEALGYPGWSRVSIGNTEENDRVIGALR